MRESSSTTRTWLIGFEFAAAIGAWSAHPEDSSFHQMVRERERKSAPRFIVAAAALISGSSASVAAITFWVASGR